MKKIIGGILIALPFSFITTLIINESSIKEAAFAWFAVIIFVGVITAGIKLMVD